MELLYGERTAACCGYIQEKYTMIVQRKKSIFFLGELMQFGGLYIDSEKNSLNTQGQQIRCGRQRGRVNVQFKAFIECVLAASF